MPPSLLLPRRRGREAKEGGAHNLYAQAIDDPERDGADEHDVAAERSTGERLTLKTVAIDSTS